MTSTLIPVTIRRSSYQPPTPVYGEPTAHPALVIVPMVDTSHRYTGTWCVLHAPSGRFLTGANHLPLGYIRQLGAMLATSGIDWPRPEKELQGDLGVRRLCRELQEEAEAAHAAGEVLGATAQSSWQLLPPLWRILTPDGPLPDEFDLDELPAVFATYEQAVAALADREQVHHKIVAISRTQQWDPPVAAELPNYLIARDTQPSWQLRCISPICASRGETGHAETLPYPDPDRAVIELEALGELWRPAGPRRWVCPWCAAEFALNAPAYLDAIWSAA
ncbi:hypothetical protein N8J89_12860 [Crossiella sp. CA-258035]|uniref:hypothetical protein n=1 Tax=Crossiella sp. CA-258035 TaxID=2981138 RepID=UPI0024BD5B4D|nr:hypothetical protein [Crossiella sp. CA-258035]WHT21911.1 hypothetical protein N8J89_12860 [Crossiella sp. CA-258035]